jgi:hypothetical protein
MLIIQSPRKGGLMIQDQIEELKKSIETNYMEKINRLKKEMMDAINSLSKVEETLFGQSKNIAIRSELTRKPILHRRKKIIKSTKIPVPKRLEAALEKMQGEFTRFQLFETVNNDATGIKNPAGTLAVVFAKLAKEGKIVVVRELRGNIPALYRKSGEEPTQRESSPLLFRPSNFIEEGKGE